MERVDCILRLTVGEAARTVSAQVERAGLSSRMVDCHELRQGDELWGAVLIFEKYYIRAGARLCMTVTLSRQGVNTRAHWVVTGGEGAFEATGDSKVAAEDYSKRLQKALLRYVELPE